jgi:broad specificity phosphatase PhoE
MRLVLCRHAEPGNVEQRQQLARELAGLRLAAVYASPLQRAMQTGRAVAELHGHELAVRDDLREIELGEVEGLSYDEYQPELQRALLESPASVRFPGGESYEELRVRVVAALDEITATHTDDTVVAVSHAGAIRAALATWLDIPAQAAFRIDQSFAAINVVDLNDGKAFVRLAPFYEGLGENTYPFRSASTEVLACSPLRTSPSTTLPNSSWTT